MTSSLALEVHWPAAQPRTHSFLQVEKPPEKCPGEDRDLYFLDFVLFPVRTCLCCLPSCALYCLPGHTVTVIPSPLVHCLAAAVRSGQLEEPRETAARGTDRPVVHLQTQTPTAGAVLRSYKPSVTPEHPSKKADAGPGPSTHLSPPPCNYHIAYT